MILLSGLAAGTIAGLFGAGGGLVLVPILRRIPAFRGDQLFPSSVAVILPVCIVSLIVGIHQEGLVFEKALPYLIGSGIGGGLAAIFGKKIPVQWLHRGLGLFILWGGIRNLCWKA